MKKQRSNRRWPQLSNLNIIEFIALEVYNFFRELTLLLALVKCAVGSLEKFVATSVVIRLLQLSQGHIFRQEVRLEFDLSRRV
jgi:hypothetical protein